MIVRHMPKVRDPKQRQDLLVHFNVFEDVMMAVAWLEILTLRAAKTPRSELSKGESKCVMSRCIRYVSAKVWLHVDRAGRRVLGLKWADKGY